MLQHVRVVNSLLVSVAGLPDDAPKRPGVVPLFLHRCQQLQQDIAGTSGLQPASVAAIHCPAQTTRIPATTNGVWKYF